VHTTRRAHTSEGREERTTVLVGSTLAGASIWQTPGGVQAELDQINGEFLAFGHEFTEVVTSLPGFPTSVDVSRRPLVDLFANAWSPLVQEWQKSCRQQGPADNSVGPRPGQKFLRKPSRLGSGPRDGMHVMSPTPIQPSPSPCSTRRRTCSDQGPLPQRSAGVAGKIAAFVGSRIGGVVLPHGARAHPRV
jgi:hypothetical protein